METGRSASCNDVTKASLRLAGLRDAMRVSTSHLIEVTFGYQPGLRLAGSLAEGMSGLRAGWMDGWMAI